MDNEPNIISEIEGFCAARGISESTFGRLAVNDGKLVRRLRSGGRMWPETIGRVREFMSRSSTTTEAAQ